MGGGYFKVVTGLDGKPNPGAINTDLLFAEKRRFSAIMAKPDFLNPDNTPADASALAAISSPQTGDTAVQVDTEQYWYYNGTAWVDYSSDNIIPGTHTFTGVTDGFRTLEATYGKLSKEGQGSEDADVTGTVHRLPFSLPGNRPDQDGVANRLRGRKFIFLYRDTNGEVIQLGTEHSPAVVLMVNEMSGAKANEYKGFDMVIEASDKAFYKGTITKATA